MPFLPSTAALFPEVLTVSQLNGRARLLLEDIFGQVWVEGELSNLARPASGHLYFTLKDARAQIRCALFRPNALRYPKLRDGQAVRLQGRVSVFEGRGDYQLIVESLEAAGEGALRLAFEALKAKLEAAGLFAMARKKALPSHPQRVGIITSPDGAVLRDIISVFQRRAAHIELILSPTPVQGSEATAQIVKAIRLADRQGFDALILARGGGSLEDLWCFNEEAVAQAITACKTPLISAVGHETDVSISDFVADVRAPTPSAAAELLSPHHLELNRQLEALTQRLIRAMQEQLHQKGSQLTHLTQRLRHPAERLHQQHQQLAALERRLGRAMQTQLSRRQQQLYKQAQMLETLSPLATLRRGYSILQDGQGQAVRHAAQVVPGQSLTARLNQGVLHLRVESLEPVIW